MGQPQPVVASTVFLLDSDWREHGFKFDQTWYTKGGSLVLSTMIGDIFAINLGVDTSRRSRTHAPAAVEGA